MSDNTIQDPILGAVTKMLDRLTRAGASVFDNEIFELLTRLAELPANEGSWHWVDYERLRTEIAANHKIKNPQVLDRELIGSRFHVLKRSGDQISPTDHSTVENPALLPGNEVLAAHANEVVLIRRLAHNYCLAYPERMALLKLFDNRGLEKSVLDRKRNHFIHYKKVNQVIISYAVKELKFFGLLQEAPGQWKIGADLPAPVIASLVVEALLKIGDYQLDIAIPMSEIREELRWLISEPVLRDSVWRRSLRWNLDPAEAHRWNSEEMLRGEVGFTRLRLTEREFLYLIECGLVDPVLIARVLKARGADEALRGVKALFMDRLDSGRATQVDEEGDEPVKSRTAGPPINKEAFLREFEVGP